MKANKLKRGDWNADNTKRFWAMHPSGREMWVAPERMEETKLAIKMGQFKVKSRTKTPMTDAVAGSRHTKADLVKLAKRLERKLTAKTA